MIQIFQFQINNNNNNRKIPIYYFGHISEQFMSPMTVLNLGQTVFNNLCKLYGGEQIINKIYFEGIEY